MKHYSLLKIVLSLVCLVPLGCAGTPSSRWVGTSPSHPLEMEPSGGPEIILRSPAWGENIFMTGIRQGLTTPDSYGLKADEVPLYELALVRLKYFSNWPRGWTEITFPLQGRLLVYRSSRGEALKSLDPPLLLPAVKAGVRYGDSFVTGETALAQVQNRIDRIQAALAAKPGTVREAPIKGFWNWAAWGWTPGWQELRGPEFFPEVYGYPPEKGPVGPWTEGEERQWDQGYTTREFPPELGTVRDSGTLFRDWEEGLGLWYLFSQWPLFWEQNFSLEVFQNRAGTPVQRNN